VAAAIGNSFVDALDTSETAPAAVSAIAIALRPFANVSEMPEDVVLAEAMAGAIADQLATLQSLAVVTEESDAMWVISGGIQRLGNVVRITANLIDRRQGAVVRAVKVDGPVDQLSRLQNEVAAELSNSVREATS
jgi:TolB-like protein